MIYFDYNDRVSTEMKGFPIAFYHLDSDHPAYRSNIHSHRYLEIAHVISGKVNIMLDQDTIEAHAGDFVVINPDVVHAYQPSKCVYDILIYDHQTIIPSYSFHCDDIYLFGHPGFQIQAHHPVSDSEVYRTFLKLFEKSNPVNPQNGFTLIGNFFELLGALFETKTFTTAKESSARHGNFNKYIKPVLQLIEQQYMHPMTIQTMASEVNLSSSHFSMLFHKYMSQAPKDYLCSYRLNQACLLLLTTNYSVSEIAYRCGFSDNAYFSRIFAKKKCMTPKQYRTTFSASKQ